jgi:hypothetical protein
MSTFDLLKAFIFCLSDDVQVTDTKIKDCSEYWSTGNQKVDEYLSAYYQSNTVESRVKDDLLHSGNVWLDNINSNCS